MCVGVPQMRKCLKLGLRPLYNSIGVLGIDLDGPMFRIYVDVSKDKPQKETGNDE